MEESMLRRFAPIAAAVALLALSPAAAQTDYPNGPVRIVVTVPAGGGVDTATRIFAEKLQQRLGQPFVIENRGGAGGNVAAEAVFVAPPDGYTLMASQPAPLTSNIALYKKLNFDPAAFEPVAVMSKFPNVLLVRQDFPAKTAAQIVAKLNRTINDIIDDAETKKRFAELNLLAAGGSPADMRKLVTEETRRWTEVIRKAGIQPE